MSNGFWKKLLVFPLIVLFVFLSIGSWYFGLRMRSRSTSGSLALSTKETVVSNWGDSIQQASPILQSQFKTPTPSIGTTRPTVSNVRLLSSDIKANLDMDYRRKGLTYYPTYITNFSAIYKIKNETKEKIEAIFQLPLPLEDSLLWNVKILANGKEKGTTITSRYLNWKGDLGVGKEKEITVTYFARGLEDFSYSLSQSTGLQDFKLSVKVNGAEKIDFPQGALSPSNINEREDGWDLSWNFENVLTSPSIKVRVFSKTNISDQVGKLFVYAPFLLVMFLGGLYGLSFLEKKELKIFDYGLLSVLYFVFYPFLAYLASVFETLTLLQALGISFAVVNLIILYYYQHLFGSSFTVTKGLALQFILLGFFPFALLTPALTGFLAIAGFIVVLAIVVQMRIGYRKNSE